MRQYLLVEYDNFLSRKMLYLLQILILLEIQKIAVEEYGMISGDYAASRYVDVTDGEVIKEYDVENGKSNLIAKLLKAIGFGD